MNEATTTTTTTTEANASSQDLAAAAADRGTHSETRKRFNVPLAYLRAFIIVLVVAQHAATAYNIIAPEGVAETMSEHLSTLRAISPVTDGQRSGMLSLFSAFNDTFMMALMFFLSGLFVWGSLQRKGNTRYLRDRLIRLGIPLILMVALRPLTYYPTYLQTGGTAGLSGFWGEWSAIPWRGGPIWFLEVLLIFDVVLVLAASLNLGIGERIANAQSELPRRVVRSFALFVVLTGVAYIPVTLLTGSFYWLQVGPAQVEINRVLFYAVYFLAGVSLGAYGIERSFVVPESGLARRWAVWSAAALVIFLVSVAVAVGGASELVNGLLQVLACAAISFAFLAVFLRFARTQRRHWDSLFRNSYGIYVIHYGVLSYISYALLGTQLPAMVKWLIAFAAGLAICWAVIAAVRRIPLVARVI